MQLLGKSVLSSGLQWTVMICIYVGEIFLVTFSSSMRRIVPNISLGQFL